MVDNQKDRLGMELAGGRYRIVGRIGAGSMGLVYRAQDRNLGTDVVIKFPVAADPSMDRTDLLERFNREIRSLVKLSHPHVVKVIDVGEDAGSPYVVLQYLSGGTLKDRLAPTDEGGPRPMPPESLHRWLADVARALDFVHAQGHIHRDVKPANILFDGHGNAFLGDFGIIKALASDLDDAWRDNSLTAPGFLLGTPGYVAPEIVMGNPPDGRSDQYALALTVHEVLTGHNLMAGPSPSATIVNQTKVELPLLSDLLPRVPRRAAEAVRRGLAKSAADRFPSCAEMAHEILAEIPKTVPPDALESETAMMPGVSLCPNCYAAVPLGEAKEGDRVRCEACQTTSLVRLSGRFPILSAAGPSPARPTQPSPPAPRRMISPSARRSRCRRPASNRRSRRPSRRRGRDRRRRRTSRSSRGGRSSGRWCPSACSCCSWVAVSGSWARVAAPRTRA